MVWSYLVLPDTHGEYERVAHVIKETETQIDTYVFAGDVLDGPDSNQLITLIRGLCERAVTIAGNHEWVCRNALDEAEDPAVSVWCNDVWPGYELDVLASYGVKQSTDWSENADALRRTMRERGDLEWLMSLKTYFETDTFVVVHAGPELDTSWSLQSTQLDTIDENNRLYNELPQLFSHKLARLRAIPEQVSNKTFITGHGHSFQTWDKRVAERRVCLASRLRKGDPLFVWNSTTRQVNQY